MPATTLSSRSTAHARLHHVRERAIETLLFLAAFFEHVSLWSFLTDPQWTPLFDDAHYGILSLLAGTLVTTAIALVVAIPVGTVTAIYLSEYAAHRTREIVKPVLELLSAVPTVVYGYFALLFVTPLLQKILPELPGFFVTA